jgi:hypothetical protein
MDADGYTNGLGDLVIHCGYIIKRYNLAMTLSRTDHTPLVDHHDGRSPSPRQTVLSFQSPPALQPGMGPGAWNN